MATSLKPLSEQVIVITGASSGIGLATARTAARKGARVVLAARSEADLRQLEGELNDLGREGGGDVALAVPTDVADEDAVRRLGEAAIGKFGRIDTWVNDAATGMWGKLEVTPLADVRKLFETNYFGLVNGSLEAVRHMKNSGGVLINVGSVVSDTAVPIQGHYAASKHAVKGFTDALRMELMNEGSPLTVTLVKPSAINTPFPKHARNHMAEEPTLPPPVYDPQIVADTILHAATHRLRDILVGGAAKQMSSLGYFAPRLMDRLGAGPYASLQKKNQPAQHVDGALYEAGGGLEERGDYEGHVLRSSLYTSARKHPLLSLGIAAAAGLAIAGVLIALTSEDEDPLHLRQTAQSIKEKLGSFI